jgi:hypothetical protein
MPEHIKTYRVFVSSPGDVQAERKAIKEVIDQINNTRPAGCMVKLEAWGWEDHIASRIGPAPQEVVNQQLPEYDIYVGILSGHFGTPTEKAGSGTEDEFLAALESYKTRGSFWISFFFDETPKTPKNAKATEQLLKVQQFKESIPEQKLGLYGTYSSTSDGQDSFRATIDRHLRTIFNQLEQPASAGATADLGAKEGAETPPLPVPASYFEWLKNYCEGLDLAGIRPKDAQAVRITQVYVPLITSTHLTDSDEPSALSSWLPNRAAEKERPQLLLDLIDRDSLYVSGVPGSGKSTFAHWLTWLCCMGHMPSEQLVGPVGYREAYPSSMNGRLPILVRLREFHENIPRIARRQEMTGAEFEGCLSKWLNACKPGGMTWDCLKQQLSQGRVLLIFDGVDEVPLEDGDSAHPCYPRAMLLCGLSEAARQWKELGNRLLVTSRPYGLSIQDQQKLNLTHAPIERLDSKLQELLVRKWFGILKSDQDQGDRVAKDFQSNVEQRADIQELLDNPMLLTAMCIVFNEGNRLPRDRHELYYRMVDNVLYNRFPEPNLRKMRRAELLVIAYAMHTGSSLGKRRETPQMSVTFEEIEEVIAVYQETQRFKQEGFKSAIDARENLVTHSGLLIPSEYEKAEFYHPSIQEHLAAQWFLKAEKAQLSDAIITRSKTKEWRHTLSFAFGAYLSGDDISEAGELVERLINKMDVKNVRLAIIIADCLDMLRGRDVQFPEESLQKFRQACMSAIEREVEIADRHILGQALGWVGDPRVEPDLRNPVSRERAFVLIKPGDYAYQDGRVQFAEPFYLSRYPVTNQQYEKFVKDQGYSTRSHWSDEGWKWKKESNISAPRFWHHPRWNCPNKPVVGVSWYEAEAYCRWAGGQLPTERQWEAAARGGAGRQYPWGNEWRDGICNSAAAGLGETSSVGLVPSSRTPDGGLEDMAGNVWEWCADWNHKGSHRVDRGGSWISYGAAWCRSAYRSRSVPTYRRNNLGFPAGPESVRSLRSRGAGEVGSSSKKKRNKNQNSGAWNVGVRGRSGRSPGPGTPEWKA